MIRPRRARLARPLGLLVLIALVLQGLIFVPSAAAASCEYRFAFAEIVDQMPESTAGDCWTDVLYSPMGDAFQYTTNGMLEWRADTGYTYFWGIYDTYVIGPNGLEQRPTFLRFPWEIELLKPTSFVTHKDPDRTFRVPAQWEPSTFGGAYSYYFARDGSAFMAYQAPFRMGQDFKLEDFLGEAYKELDQNQGTFYEIAGREILLVNGQPTDVIVLSAVLPVGLGSVYSFDIYIGFFFAVQDGENIQLFEFWSSLATLEAHGPALDQFFLSIDIKP